MSGSSMLDPRWRRLARVRLYCNGSCITAIVTGCLVLCGWIFHVELLKSVFQGSTSIDVITSLGLIFLGVSLWLLLPDPPRRAYRYWGLFFGTLVACIGAITVIENAFGADRRLNHLLFKGSVGVITTHSPERMPLVTGMTFLVLGMALLLVDRETPQRLRPAELLSLWGVFAGIMSLSGYVNGAAAIYIMFSYTQVAVFTALVLFMMSTAIFFARPRVGIAGDLTGRFLGSAMTRRFLPAVFIVPLLGAWIRVQGQRAVYSEQN